MKGLAAGADPERVRDVVVLRALGLGDVLTAVPALRGVRRRWPGARVTLVAPSGPGEWVRSLGLVDDVVPADGVRGLPTALGWSGSGHVAVNLHGSGPESHRLLLATEPRQLVAFGCREADHDGPVWDGGEHEVDRWIRLVRSVGGACSREDLRLRVPRRLPVDGGLFEVRPTAGVLSGGVPTAVGSSAGYVVVHPGAASGSRRWPAERWGAVVGELVADGHDVVLTGSDAERDLCGAIERAAAPGAPSGRNGAPSGRDAAPSDERRSPRGGVRSLAGALHLGDLAAVVGHADLLLCGDTGVAHLGTALGTSSVVLFGPTPPWTWGPVIDRDRHVVLWHGTELGDPHGAELDAALAEITVDEVLDATRGLIGEGPGGVDRPAGLFRHLV